MDFISNLSIDVLQKILDQLRSSDYSGEPPWVKYWVNDRIRSIQKELKKRYNPHPSEIK